ncbi:MAG: hypothetical protein ICV79_18895 [Flavisolibacter sp.]|nr:hypothetical protein [Flavisolibacter sp.]
MPKTRHVLEIMADDGITRKMQGNRCLSDFRSHKDGKESAPAPTGVMVSGQW